MERPVRNHTVELNVVLSGHKRMIGKVRVALQAVGFELSPDRADNWGLSSYTDPITAEKAGKPNAGHTPGTKHPDALRHLVLEEDHEPGCTHLAPEEWIAEHPEWKPKVSRIPTGEDDAGKKLFLEVEEVIDPNDERLHLPCEHVGTTEWRGHECRHAGGDYAADERMGFIGATIQCAPTPEALGAAASKADEVASAIGWTLRQHSRTEPKPDRRPSLEERVTALEGAQSPKES